MVGQRAVAVRPAESRPREAQAKVAEQAGRPATGRVGRPPVVPVPVVRVKARGLAAMLLREAPRDLRPGCRGVRRPTGRAGRRARRAPPRREQARPMARRARAGTLRVIPPMVMAGLAAGGPRPVASSAARAGLRPQVSSAAARAPRRPTAPGRPTGAPPTGTPRAAPRGARLGHRRAALPVTGPGPRGRTGPGRRARGTANVTAAGRQIATSGVMTAVRLRGLQVIVLAVRTPTTAPQRATGRVASAAGMAPRLAAASVLKTGA